MYYNTGNYTKTSCQADITRKQAMWNRFKRRYWASDNPTERRFLKNEATRVANELKQWSKRWQNWGFGHYAWITKNYSISYFTQPKTYAARKSSPYKSPTRKTYARRTTSRRPKSRTTSRTRTSAARKSYVAW